MFSCFMSAARAELWRAGAAAPKLRSLDPQQTSFTAVLATTGPSLLNHGSYIAVGVSYLLWTGNSAVGACGDEHSSRRWFDVTCCGTRYLRSNSRYLHATTSPTFSQMSFLDSNVETRTPPMPHLLLNSCNSLFF